MSNSVEKEELENELVTVAMQIILYAGNARALADEAFKFAKEEDFQVAYKKMKEADQEILKAHQTQTKVIQDETRGISHEPSLLFNHAQDHLMTIMSEIRITNKMIELHELTLKRK
ncbi:PTS cellobiose transporter subunit IIA [Pullulanibacillus camelliae]|uniref:PTS cellobiose transporter subunit IIA n=1 Tax=Pullulanibacillus camelliae TaxID=1707096 RepID=A0A8J3E0N3_9BACL|nr:PTS lactose/cellobiose transporter subunit IIA [Pullulanibacillus camelliae]GGE54938.1 PTS cellobiose transporter subunit IIA [Pullulanibacillus camelliae]